MKFGRLIIYILLNFHKCSFIALSYQNKQKDLSPPHRPLLYRRASHILGDPGADSGDEEKSKRAEKYMARRKVKNDEKSPWGQCLTRPVPNGSRRSGF